VGPRASAFSPLAGTSGTWSSPPRKRHSSAKPWRSIAQSGAISRTCAARESACVRLRLTITQARRMRAASSTPASNGFPFAIRESTSTRPGESIRHSRASPPRRGPRAKCRRTLPSVDRRTESCNIARRDRREGSLGEGREEHRAMLKKGFKQYLAEANAAVETVSVADARQLHAAGGAVFVDVREGAEHAQGHIPGSVSVPRGFLEFIADPETPMHNPALSSGKRLVLYCASGGRSALAAKTLCDMGIANVCH